MQLLTCFGLLSLAACSTEFVVIDELRCSDEGWWDESYAARRSLVIDTVSPLPPGYQLRLALPEHAGAGDDEIAQLRVVTRLPDGRCGELPRHFDQDAAELWFPVPDGNVERKHWLYSGAENPSPPPDDPRDVFDLFFDPLHPAGDLDWDLVGTTVPTVLGSGASGAESATTKDRVEEDTVVETRAMLKLQDDEEAVHLGLFAPPYDLSGAFFGIIDAPSVYAYPYQVQAGHTYDPPPLGTLGVAMDPITVEVTIVRDGPQVWVSSAGADPVELPVPVEGPMALQFHFAGSMDSMDPSTHIAPTHLRVRHYLVDEPRVTLGPLQPR